VVIERYKLGLEALKTNKIITRASSALINYTAGEKRFYFQGLQDGMIPVFYVFKHISAHRRNSKYYLPLNVAALLECAHNPKMKTMKRIVLLSATDRPSSKALEIAGYLKTRFEHTGTQPEIVSLEDYPLERVAGGRYGASIPEVEVFNERVLSADGLVFIVPEYNGSFPGILKMFIDYLPFPEAFRNLPLAFIGEASGAFGALRAVEHLQQICGYRNALMFPERVFIQRVNQNFDKDTGIADAKTNEFLESLIRNFTDFVSAYRHAELV
jgi:chromate reductase, NAD(P)H dehydrogenase (quinone)